jgi:iron complex transport system substrate-binding protein
MKSLGFWILMGITLGIFSCSKSQSKPEFPKGSDLILPKYTHLFKIAICKGCTYIKLINPADTFNEIGNFCLGDKNPNTEGFTYISHPKRIVALSAVFVGMIEALRSQNNIVAVDNLEFISSPKTANRIKAGFITAVATNSLDPEKLVATKPGVVLGYFIDQKGKESFNQVIKKGIPVLFLQNFLESHPLGRAEWLLVIGALTGNLRTAQDLFAEIEEHYLSTQARVEAIKEQPTVLINAPFSGTWDIPAGNSYMAHLVNDAGGVYAFSQTKGTGRIPMGIEQVYNKAGNADYWINPGVCREEACLLMMDQRINKFKAINQKQVYNCTKLLTENGANPWWDYGVMRPDLVLLDLFTLLHPEIYTEHELVFFEKVK